ncbi:hypothetical protein [Chitinophaga japonensis]|uniref:Uncharacterized protein n=1 Tax=Chitinophaga japonensis TaxID=104662 RepID=A0A562T6Z4_CHIJA|nr:hypothetical protein [Chitinophaga japonensis]TWI89262.1 hypothetical protein LX66_3357 [Chitinophaga japonensis]
MAKDRRYKTVKALIESGQLKNFQDIYDILPKSVIGADLKINYYKSTKHYNNPGTFEVDEIIKLSRLIEVDDVVLYQLLSKARKGAIK